MFGLGALTASKILTNKYFWGAIIIAIAIGIGAIYINKKESQLEELQNIISENKQIIHLHEKNAEVFKKNEAKFEMALKTQKQTIINIRKDVKKIQEKHANFVEEKKKASIRLSSLEDKFNKIKPNGEKRDIGKIANKKPNLFNNIINRATKNSLRCLELATGSPFNEKELKEGYVNRECPEFFEKKHE